MLRFAALFLALGSLYAQESYKVRLTPVPVDAATRANIAGSGAATATLSGNQLTIKGTFGGLRTGATIAQLHQGAAVGVRGASVADLTVDKATQGSLSGSVDLTPAQVENLRRGKLYIQIHSEKAPEGNLWGWILR